MILSVLVIMIEIAFTITEEYTFAVGRNETIRFK